MNSRLPDSRLIHVGCMDGYYRLILEFYELPERTNNSYKNNFRALHFQRKRWKQAVLRIAFHVRPREPMAKARLVLTRFSSSECDFDGLVSSFKPLIDGLKEAGVIQDDSMRIIGQPTYLWEKIKRGEGKVRIDVSAV